MEWMIDGRVVQNMVPKDLKVSKGVIYAQKKSGCKKRDDAGPQI
jgi:hypothetical protein